MATYGKVKPFNPKADDWEVYEEQLRFYMVANNITDPAKKRSILLTVCGDHTFKLLRSLVPDGKLDADDITYDSLVGLLKSHYKKKQSVVVHRFNFNTRARKPSESIADYIAALRELAMNCNFGSKERLEEMLRDRWFAALTTMASNASYCLKVTFHTRMLWPSLSPLSQRRTMPRN